MSVIYSKIKKSICLHNECLLRRKKSSILSNCSESMDSQKMSTNGSETPEDYPSSDIIINVLDTNNNCLNLIDVRDVEESKPRVVTRTLFSRSDSQCSQTTPTKRVTYGGMFGRFVDAIDEMNKIVLIPSRLQDIECTEEEEIPVVFGSTNSGCDMHSGFKLLNSFRNSIVHSSTTVTNGYDHNDRSMSPKLVKQYSVNSEKSKDFLKEVSLDSGYTSIVNDSQSQSYSSTSSVTEDDSSDVMSDMSDMALSFYHHLYGLNVVLEKLIETANFISHKYEKNLQ